MAEQHQDEDEVNILNQGEENVDGEQNAEDPQTEQEVLTPEVEDLKDSPMVTISQAELDQIKQESAENKDKYIRLYAEFENVRRRTERERIEFVKYANEEIICEFLSVLDNLELSVKAATAKHEDYQAFLKGIEMVMTHIYEMLRKSNVKSIETKGKDFDPHLHEVLLQEETDDHPEGAIIDEFQKGYFLEEKVIRTAKVKVASPKK